MTESPNKPQPPSLPHGWRQLESRKTNRRYFIGPAGTQWQSPQETGELEYVSPRKTVLGAEATEPPEPSLYQADFRPWDAVSLAAETRRQRHGGYEHSPSQRVHPKATVFDMQSQYRAAYSKHEVPPVKMAHQWPVVTKPAPFGHTSTTRAEFIQHEATARRERPLTSSMIPRKPFIANSTYRSDFDSTIGQGTIGVGAGSDPKRETLSRTALVHAARQAAKLETINPSSNSTRGHNEVGGLVLQYHSRPEVKKSERVGKKVGAPPEGELSSALLSTMKIDANSTYRSDYVPQPQEASPRSRRCRLKDWMEQFQPNTGHEYSSSYRDSYTDVRKQISPDVLETEKRINDAVIRRGKEKTAIHK